MIQDKLDLRLQDRPAAKVNLIGGRLCLDFVNSIGARRVNDRGEMTIRDEKLTDYFDIIAWAQHATALSPAETIALCRLARRQPRKAALMHRSAIELREALYRVLKAIIRRRSPNLTDLCVVNRWIRRACAARMLTARSGGFGWEWADDSVSLERILWMVCESATEMLTRGDLSRLRRCGGDDCGWIFEDTTRNRSRHWCDTRDCGNRDRVRRFRQQQHRVSRQKVAR